MPKGRRRATVAVAALLAVGFAAVTVYRVFSPAEVSTVARAGYPPIAEPEVGVVGRLSAAPLIIDGRLRVYATTRQVWADRPVDGRNRNTPYWSYRRWPAEVSGVVAVGTTVVSRWSDGRIVGVDAQTGRVSWKVDGPTPKQGYTGRRTGAAAVWAAEGLHTATATDGRAVVVAAGDDGLAGIEPSTGRTLWRTKVKRGCRTDVGTTTAGHLIGVDTCAEQRAVEFRDVDTGAVTERWRPPGTTRELAVTPIGCAIAASECRGVRTVGSPSDAPRGWLVSSGKPVAAPGLDGRDTALAVPTGGAALSGELAIETDGDAVVGRSVRTGRELWRRTDLGPCRVVAGQPGRVHLLTESNDLVTLDPTNGGEQSRFPLIVGRDGRAWEPGHAYAADGYLAVERLKRDADPADDDRAYYLVAEPIVLAAT